MVELDNIEKSYDHPVLKGFNYTFNEGKMYVIKGVSGCGKSTLLNIIGGLDDNYSGTVRINGKTLGEFSKKKKECYREKVSYIFQNSLLIAKLTVKENLLFIKEDIDKILYYANKVGVQDLLDKYPDQLSGGERQRIALVRAMLNDPQIIVADEPTASLDSKNSVNIASLLRMLTDDNCITIIATHENCFDELADEIISLNYVTIDSVKQQSITNEQFVRGCEMRKHKEKKYKKRFWLYVFKRNRKKYTVVKLLPGVLIFLMFLFALSLQNNVQSWYINEVLKNYPYTMLSASSNQLSELNRMCELEVYENYTYPIEGIGVYPLFEKQDSGIAYSNNIALGNFPVGVNEIVVSKDYVEKVLNINKYTDAIGREVQLGENDFIIVGILSDLNVNEQGMVFYSNVYYQNCNSVSIFIPYTTLKKIGTLVESPLKMVKMQNLYDREQSYKEVRRLLGGPITEWDARLVEVQYIIDSIFGVILAGIIILSLILIVFIKNEVQLELYYRRKEIGFLQIFNLRKHQIHKMLLVERSMRSCISLMISVFLYSVISIWLQLMTGYHVMVKWNVLALFIIVAVSYNILITWIPCNKFLKKDIIELIT